MGEGEEREVSDSPWSLEHEQAPLPAASLNSASEADVYPFAQFAALHAY